MYFWTLQKCWCNLCVCFLSKPLINCIYLSPISPSPQPPPANRSRRSPTTLPPRRCTSRGNRRRRRRYSASFSATGSRTARGTKTPRTTPRRSTSVTALSRWVFILLLDTKMSKPFSQHRQKQPFPKGWILINISRCHRVPGRHRTGMMSLFVSGCVTHTHAHIVRSYSVTTVVSNLCCFKTTICVMLTAVNAKPTRRQQSMASTKYSSILPSLPARHGPARWRTNREWICCCLLFATARKTNANAFVLVFVYLYGPVEHLKQSQTNDVG